MHSTFCWSAVLCHVCTQFCLVTVLPVGCHSLGTMLPTCAALLRMWRPSVHHLSWHPWLQNSANGGTNLAGVGGSSYYGGEGGGKPAHSLGCHLPVSGSALAVYCLWEQAQHFATEASFMQLPKLLSTGLPVSCTRSAAL